MKTVLYLPDFLLLPVTPEGFFSFLFFFENCLLVKISPDLGLLKSSN